MAGEVLTNTVTIGPLAAGASVTVSHGIGTAALGSCAPNIILPDRASAIAVTAVTTTQITFKNNGTAVETATFWLQRTHSIQSNLPSQQTWWQGLTSSSGGGGATSVTFDRTSTDNLSAFVDGVNGNDSNDGLTALTALKTISAVYSKFPWFMLNGSVLTINIAGVGGFGSSATAQLAYTEGSLLAGGALTTSDSYRYKGPSMVRVTPTSGPATAALDAVPAVAVGQRTRFDFTAAAPGWTVDDFSGQFLRVTRGGVPVFCELPISSNTANGIFVDMLGIVGVVLNTDTVEIVKPGVKISGPVDFVTIQGTGAFDNVTGALTFERIAFGFLAGRGDGIGFDRCQWTGGLTFMRVNGAALANVTAIAATISWEGSTTEDEIFPNVDPATIAPGVHMQFLGVKNSQLVIGGITTAGLGYTASGHFCGQENVSMYAQAGGVGAAIRVAGNSTFYMSPTFALQGSNPAATAALHAVAGGKIRVNSGALTTISAVGNPLKIDASAAVAYGVGAGQFEEAAGYNGNLSAHMSGAAAAPIGDGGSRIFTANV